VLLTFLLRCLDRFVGAGHDDTFITLLAAEKLAAGDGFVTPNGEPGEIGSSLVHVLLLALLQKIGVPDLYLANKALGFLCGSGALLLIVTRRQSLFVEKQSMMPALLAACLSANLPTYAFWSMGGLETPIVALLVTWLATDLLLATPRACVRTGVCASLLALVRPEGFVYLGTVLAWGVAVRRSRRWWYTSLGFPLFVLLLVTVLRWSWLGSPVPLPVLAKVGVGSPVERLANGTSYVWAFARASPLGMLVLCVAGVRWVQTGWQLATGSSTPESLPKYVAPLLVVSTQLSAAAIAGGDWMAYYRFIAPAIPLLCVILVQFAWDLLDRVSASPLLRKGGALAWLCAIPWLVVERSGLRPPYMHDTCMQGSIFNLLDERLGYSLGERVRRLNHPYFRDEAQLLPFIEGPLHQLLDQRHEITIATHQMGFFPYHLRKMLSERIRLIDTLGIVDPELSRLPAPRTPLGLAIGLDPTLFLNPESQDPVARAIHARHPDLVYVLRADDHTIEQLARWGWTLVWNAPEAKIFAHNSLHHSDSALAR